MQFIWGLSDLYLPLLFSAWCHWPERQKHSWCLAATLSCLCPSDCCSLMSARSIGKTSWSDSFISAALAVFPPLLFFDYVSGKEGSGNCGPWFGDTNGMVFHFWKCWGVSPPPHFFTLKIRVENSSKLSRLWIHSNSFAAAAVYFPSVFLPFGNSTCFYSLLPVDISLKQLTVILEV